MLITSFPIWFNFLWNDRIHVAEKHVCVCGCQSITLKGVLQIYIDILWVHATSVKGIGIYDILEQKAEFDSFLGGPHITEAWSLIRRLNLHLKMRNLKLKWAYCYVTKSAIYNVLWDFWIWHPVYLILLFYPDERFPSDATVEFVFSSGPERIKGSFSLPQNLLLHM